MKLARTPTLQTIADAAGVSRSTVSLAIRNDPALPPATRQRIQQIAADIGYRPNPMISALMAHLKAAKPLAERGTIAFLTSHPSREGWRKTKVFRDYFDGAVERASRLGYRLEEFWLKEPGMTAARMTLILETRGVVGIIVAPFPVGRGHLSLDVSHFASVALGYSMTRPKLHRAANHQIESIRLGLRELKHCGYNRIGLVFNQNHDRRANCNYSAGFLAFQQAQPPADRVPICFTDGMTPRGLRRWLHKHRPEAIIGGSPEVLAWLAEENIRVPDDVAVALLADPSKGEQSVAGIDQLGELTGAAAVDLIAGQVHRNERGVPENPKITLTESVWIDGDTIRTIRAKASSHVRSRNLVNSLSE